MDRGAAAHEKNGATTSETKTVTTNNPLPEVHQQPSTITKSSCRAFPESLRKNTGQEALDNRGSFRDDTPQLCQKTVAVGNLKRMSNWPPIWAGTGAPHQPNFPGLPLSNRRITLHASLGRSVTSAGRYNLGNAWCLRDSHAPLSPRRRLVEAVRVAAAWSNASCI